MTDPRISVAQARADSRFYAHRVEPIRREPITPVLVKREPEPSPLDTWMDK